MESGVHVFPLIIPRLPPFGLISLRHPRFLLRSSNYNYYNSSFLDFQDYAKPKQLLPTTEPIHFVEESLDKIISSLQSDASHSLYKVLLRTSSIYGSELSDLKAGVLISIIDENGDSILQRIPAILCQDQIIHFQRGSVDEFIFWGPRLAKIQAFWISLESGTWRLGGASLTIISTSSNQLAEDASKDERLYYSISYNFETEDVLLGERSDVTMAQLRPSLVTDYYGSNPLSSTDINVKKSESLIEKGIRNKESMREYANLKYSLLLYDAALIFAGTTISSLTGGENTALAFLAGGIGGFLYLLLLQRSVDELPVTESILTNEEGSLGRLFGGLRGRLIVLAFTLGVALLVTRRELLNINGEAALTPRDILVGMLGFLACKVSVVLAAFKPISTK